MCTIIGAWGGAFVIPLDWHEPWQKWPIPCTYGALLGYFVSVILLFLLSPLVPKHQRPGLSSKITEKIQKQRAEDAAMQASQQESQQAQAPAEDESEDGQAQRRRKRKHRKH